MAISFIEKIELVFWKALNKMMCESLHTRLLVKYIFKIIGGELQTQFIPTIFLLGVLAFTTGLILTLIII